ncbi:MAG: hypothetical protein ACYDD1_17460 [Caulobacteraceae bacterium]
MSKSHLIHGPELKAHVRILVKAFGGVDPAGVELGVSAERVSQWQRTTHNDQMPLLCIHQLEHELGRDIVTGAFSRAVHGETHATLATAIVASVSAAAKALQAVTDMDNDGRRTAGEIQHVQAAAQELKRIVEELSDTAAQLTPGPSI